MEVEDFIKPWINNSWMEEFARKWIADANGEEPELETSENLKAWMQDGQDVVLGCVLTLLMKTKDDPKLHALVSAGPLENFLADCQDKYLEIIEQLIPHDSVLKESLKELWEPEMSNERYSRIHALARKTL
jgi:hypothetical protein